MTFSVGRRALLAPVAAALALLALSGCGPKPRAAVKGAVTWGGRPVKMGTVVFVTADDQVLGSGVIDASGNYAVNDAPVGEDKVYITLPPRPMGRGGLPAPPPGLGAMPADKQPVAAGGMPSSNPQDYPFWLSPQYQSAEATTLKFKVKSGQNTFNITLTP
jgi:hypothetical protein